MLTNKQVTIRIIESTLLHAFLGNIYMIGDTFTHTSAAGACYGVQSIHKILALAMLLRERQPAELIRRYLAFIGLKVADNGVGPIGREWCMLHRGPNTV
jgi:hypothetical protein